MGIGTDITAEEAMQCRAPAEAERPLRVGGGEGEWLLWLAASTLELGFSVRTGRCASAGCTPLPASCSPSPPLASSAAELWLFSAAAASAARWCAQRPPPRPRPRADPLPAKTQWLPVKEEKIQNLQVLKTCHSTILAPRKPFGAA